MDTLYSASYKKKWCTDDVQSSGIVYTACSEGLVLYAGTRYNHRFNHMLVLELAILMKMIGGRIMKAFSTSTRYIIHHTGKSTLPTKESTVTLECFSS